MKRFFCAVTAFAIFFPVATASAVEPTLTPFPATADVFIRQAVEAEERGEFADAADAYLVASAYDAQLSAFLRYRALRAWNELIAAEGAVAPTREQVDRLADGVVDSGFEGAATTAVRASAFVEGVGLGDVTILEQALESPDRAEVCVLLQKTLEQSTELDPSFELPLANLHYGYCSDTEIAPFPNAKPSLEMRLKRAERLYGQVRFYAAADELERMGPFDEIDDTALRCRAKFRMARTTYRIRKRRSESEPLYKDVAETCTAPELSELRKSALYKVGDRRWDLNDPTGAKPWFETLLKDYPNASHADDAIMYLARIAREQGDRDRELELLELVQQEKYRDGDMFGEIAWEVLEPLYREGKYAEFVDAVQSLERPEHDDHYYSQGRLEYFVGQAKVKLGDADAGYLSWQDAWQTYPWSFYGYLSRMRLLDAGQTPAEPTVVPAATPPWLDSRDWRLGAIGRLHAVGGPELAVSFAASARAKTPEGRWHVAYVNDRAGRYAVSHNIVRRRIDGRPWSDPLTARLTQWKLAWPDPFGSYVDDAATAEATQDGTERVRAALARAIMREESSFIEDIESYAGALGLMQLMPATALAHDDDTGEATPERLKTAEVNVRVGLDHLFWLARQWDDHPVLMVAAYNAGSGRIRRWMRSYGSDDIALFVEDIPTLQTRGYTKRVIGSYAAYQWLAGRSDLDARVLGPGK